MEKTTIMYVTARIRPLAGPAGRERARATAIPALKPPQVRIFTASDPQDLRRRRRLKPYCQIRQTVLLVSMIVVIC